MPYRDLHVRLRAQKHYINDGEDLTLTVSGNGAYGTTVSVLQCDYQPPLHQPNCMMKTIGTVDRGEWMDLMRDIGQPHRGHQGGPRVGQGGIPYLTEIRARNVWNEPLPWGGWPETILIRVEW